MALDVDCGLPRMTAPNTTTLQEKDPVCGMTVNPATARHVGAYKGANYYFCCAHCLEKFQLDPKKYLHRPVPAQSQGLVTLGMPSAQGKADATRSHSHTPVTLVVAHKRGAAPAYVCPMCPEVREAKPGTCPSCGMVLEPEIPVAATRTEYTCPMHPEI